ncbi:hypothetical protein EWH99_06135 [Sporolactobacillus sp. THM7-7]|nr:hypothetical protein EWH99_06135 [Sporolactobacillus sp. THM7-7]
MLEDHVKVMMLIHQAGEIAGRRKLQKMVYILQKSGIPFHQTYYFYDHGPYSEELSVQLEELYHFGFLAEQKEARGGVFHYRLTNGGISFLKRYKKPLMHAGALAETLNAERVTFLELVSILLYFDHLPRSLALKKTRAISKNFEKRDMERAFHFIDALNVRTRIPVF